MSLKSIVRDIYDATSDSSSMLGKFGRWHVPGNLQYWMRDVWRRYGKNLFGGANSASSLSSYGSDIYGPTGSIVGRY